MDYAEFLESKRLVHRSAGIQVEPGDIHESLFPFQRALVRWALGKGRCALFADTGLGKSAMQIEWARLTGQRTLIFAPLAVARQTVAEGRRIGVDIVYARHQREAAATGLTITNYEMLDHFDPAEFGAVVLDESGILKNFTGITKKQLIKAFADTPFRLCCSATPAPNDTVELCNHAHFLGLMKPADMLSTFFITVGGDKKDGKFRLKAHARTAFYRWLASWAMSIKKPSDLGFDDAGYELPPLSIEPVIVEHPYTPETTLFRPDLKGVGDRARIRRSTIEERVKAAAELVLRETVEQWLLWCGLNDESNLLSEMLRSAGVTPSVVEGADIPDTKAERLTDFADGRARVLITKPSIAGFGLNFQRCARMAFVGISDSYESYYQAIRRCYRFGQTRPVRAFIVLSDTERPVYDNVLRKEKEAATLSRELIAHIVDFEREEIGAEQARIDAYTGQRDMTLPEWLTTLTDSIQTQEAA